MDKDADEEGSSGGELVIVKVDLVDSKKNSSTLNKTRPIDESSWVPDENLFNSELNVEFSKEDDKISRLNSHLETPSLSLELAESENTILLEEVTKPNPHLLQREKYCAELEDDLNRLREENMESESQYQESLEKITLELSKVQEELQNSRSRGVELEQDIISKVAIIQELKLEFNQYKASHSHPREDLISMEGLVSVLKEELQSMNDSLEEISLKFQQEVRKRETVEEHNLELQKLVQESHSNSEDSIKKMNESHILLEISEFQVHELEENLIIMERKLMDALAVKDQNDFRLSEISSELEALCVKSSSLEMALQAANETEKDLVDVLNRVNEEKRKLEDSVNVSERKLLEAENVIEILKLELKSSMEKYHQNDKNSEIKIHLESYELNHKDGGGKLMEKSKSLEEWAIFHQDHENETREIPTIKEVLVDERSNPLILPDKTDAVKERVKIPAEMLEKFYLETCVEGLDGNPKHLKNQLEFYSEALERENLKLIVSLTICETHVNELQTALNRVLTQGNEACAKLQYPRQRLASEGRLFQSHISSIHRDQGENKQIQGGTTQMEENLNDDETLSLESDMKARISMLEHQLLLSEREVEGVSALLREKEAALDYISEEKNGVIKELSELQRELNIAFKKLHERSGGEILQSQTNGAELESKDLPQAGVEPSKLNNDGRNIRSIGLSHKEGKISEVPIEEPTIETSFRFILGVIVTSIVLALIIGKR